METDLGRAMERGELPLAYQPVVDLKSGRIAGFEALMWWNHPKRGPTPPAEFIPAAEASGLIGPIMLFALEQASRDMIFWGEQSGEQSIFVSVGLSSTRLFDEAFFNDVRALTHRTGCDPKRLKIELNGSAAMENPEQARLALARVRELGLGLVLDDCGTVSSPLGLLTGFAFDTVKIDRTLVTSHPENRDLLLKPLISMAHGLDMRVVAKGVGTEEDAASIAAMGCDLGQSFLFGPPVRSDAVLRLLKERSRTK